jgi:hypothetical protein
MGELAGQGGISGRGSGARSYCRVADLFGAGDRSEEARKVIAFTFIGDGILMPPAIANDLAIFLHDLQSEEATNSKHVLRSRLC